MPIKKIEPTKSFDIHGKHRFDFHHISRAIKRFCAIFIFAYLIASNISAQHLNGETLK